MIQSVNKEGDVKATNDYRSLTSPVIRNTRLVTVEPVIAGFMMADGIFYGVQSEFIQGRIAILHNYTLPNNAENGTCSVNESNAQSKLQSEIQAETSVWLMYFTLAYALPSIFMTVIIGAWSDSVGRRFAVLTSSAGTLINFITWTLVAHFELHLEILIASSFVKGLCGATSLFNASCFTYICDVTTKENRTPRIIVCDCVLLLSLGIGQLCGGFLVDYFDFTITFTISVCFTSMAIIYTSIPYLLRETILIKTRFKENLTRSINGVVKVLAEKDVEYRKTFYIINFVFFILTTFTTANSPYGLLIVHFLGEPFCFSFLLLSYYSAAMSFSPALGLVMCALFLKRWLDDYWLLHLGMCSAMLFFYVGAAAKTTAVAFVGVGLGIFKTLFGPSCRSLVSKSSSPQEQGAVFGFLGMADALAGIASPLILNNIYSVTVYSMPTFVFWMCGSFCLLPIIAVSYLQLNNRNKKQKIVIDVNSDITPDNPSMMN
ncbi:solute carrier family 46 member 3-like isoform X1 [Anneissia japonica]|uniref:solute carrier family 46 member 3-like isoform X1 n=1 Tax=Anneissia japonica TaxID=1529436 RepID=UPI00142563C0|nr:solute carrier family 46 member 3-like isoform X1 [Anneissia japonica]XP_033112839.1 solute carrier family 46 member 3-like isoform X1 [Anneissia japonica]XP_033112840.1 solute carrier family 46 member 3-like isoform X1 [Anneissia japonica]XP_033112841.1 solute carrier family 46 member 3-like isoform X1 [Anneissia japonica]XP_033112842.1 solute carrier family 46 member 3-like isoform X1 [Anneissia japonica]